MKLGDIAKILNGRLNGSPDIDITGVAEIMRAVNGDITFVSKKKYLPELKHSKASAVILQEGLDEEGLIEKSSVIVKNPYLSLISLLKLFYPVHDNLKGISPQSLIKTKNIGRDVTIHPFVCIEDNVVVGDRVVIYPFTYIGKDSRIAEGSIVHSNVSIYHNVIVGKNVIIHSGAVIGSDGFGFVKDDNGVYQKIPQVGNVIIEDDVEIGANVCIDRATLGSTIIKKGVKIDNLVQIAHNVTIGDNTVIAGQTGVSGSCNIGKNVIMGGQVGLADHLNIGDGVIVGGKAGVTGDIEAGVYSGIPAIEHNQWKRIQAGLTKLPELIKKVRELEKRVEELIKATTDEHR
ncbi:MAG: UDP-3-O-(3-hydroxymyristoyl)glucosamine N-acyltransferase [Nitrospinae bacterium]|nr:UDP-3-O-(3-hydroxymyristoyl)glucosamine N-acyltransferase [Nitrospinota bacterium]